ncbi:hypothetical protein EMCRGX_G028802 [Ephydatia muelleri]
MPSRQEKKRAKRRAKYLQVRDDVLESARASYKADPEKKQTAEREGYHADPEKKRSAKRQRYHADQKKGPEKKRECGTGRLSVPCKTKEAIEKELPTKLFKDESLTTSGRICKLHPKEALCISRERKYFISDYSTKCFWCIQCPYPFQFSWIWLLFTLNRFYQLLVATCCQGCYWLPFASGHSPAPLCTRMLLYTRTTLAYKG